MKINSESTLKLAILQLEERQKKEGEMLKSQFHIVYESLKPVNLIRSTLKEASSSPELKTDLVNTSIGVAAGYVSKLLVQGLSANPLRKLLGSLFMFGVTNLVNNNPETVKAIRNKVFKLIGKDFGETISKPPLKPTRGRMDVI
jgi:hypothetical protein